MLTHSRRRGVQALSLALLAVFGLVAASPAFAYRDHHRHWHHHGGYYGGGYYGAPPVVYGAPTYAAPPVVYSPGINVGIHLGR
jgi:hypothetical protein